MTRFQRENGANSRGTGENVFAIAPANSEVVPGTEAMPLIGRVNKPRTLDELDRELAAQEAGLQRCRFPVSEIRVEPGRLIAGRREFLLTDAGERRLCKRFQAPAEYVATIKPSFRALLLQDHLFEGRYADDKLSDKNSCLLIRGDTFLDLGRSDLYTLNNATVVEAVREGVGSAAAELEVRGFHVDDESFALDTVSPQLAEEVRPGDILRAGVHVEHSQLNGQATQVMAYVTRLVCKNGMVHRECLGQSRSTPRTRRLSVDRPEAKEMQKAQIRKLVAETWGGLKEKLGVIRRLRDKDLSDVRNTLERFLRQAHLYSRALMDSLLVAWEQEGSEKSAFGALNAITRVATHSTELPSWKRQRLARLAGVYANQNVHLCPHCFSILATR